MEMLKSLTLTVVTVKALLLSRFGSLSLVTLAVLLNVVPDGVPGGMCPVIVKVTFDPAGSVAMVQVTVWPVVQLSNGPEVCEKLTNVIVPGSVSLNETVVAASGPAFPRLNV